MDIVVPVQAREWKAAEESANLIMLILWSQMAEQQTGDIFKMRFL